MIKLKNDLDILIEEYKLRNEKVKMQTDFDINQLEEAKRVLEHGKGLSEKQLEKLRNLLTAVIDNRTAIAVKEIDSENAIAAAKEASEFVQQELAEMYKNKATYDKTIAQIDNATKIGEQKPIDLDKAIENVYNANAVLGAERNAGLVVEGQKKVMLELLKRQLKQEKSRTKISESTMKEILEAQLEKQYTTETNTAVKKYALSREKIKGVLHNVLSAVGINKEVSLTEIEDELNKAKLNNAKVATEFSKEQLYKQMTESIRKELEYRKEEEKLQRFNTFVDANEKLLNNMTEWKQDQKDEMYAVWTQGLQSMFGNGNK